MTSCAPATVFTGGQFVTLTGTNFRTAYPLPDINGPLPDPLPTVRVTFNGRAARSVRVASATSLTCIAPAGDAGAATVVLTNLDEDGVAIPGEVVTSALIATYARADLSVAADLSRVVRTFIRLLKQQVIQNVVKTVSVDYTDDAGKLEFNLTDIAELPCVAVVGPRLRRNQFYGEPSEVEQRGVNYVRRRYLRTNDIVLRVLAFDDADARIHSLHALLVQVLENNNYFEVARDASDASKGSVFYELDAGDFDNVGGPNNSNVRAVSGEVTLRGFTFEDVAGFTDSMVAEKGTSVDNIEVTTQALTDVAP